MKRIILIVFLSFFATKGFSQGTNNFVGIYAGGGVANANNYDVALSGGFEFLKGLFHRTALGVTIFYQSYGILYDNEAYGFKDGTGNAGVTVLNKSSYIFFAPKIIHGFGKREFLNFFLDAGAGYNMSGTETMRKWDRSNGSVAGGNYDSTIATTANINKLLIRVGTGFIEYIHLNKKWWFTVTEDVGFLGSSLSKTSDATNPSRTQYSPNSLNPVYFSLQIGITHSRYWH